MEYVLKRSNRSRSLRLRLEPDGTVVVTAPRLVPKLMIDAFVKTAEAWVTKQKRRHTLRKLAAPVLDWDERVVSYMGQLLRIRFDTTTDGRVEVRKGFALIHPVTGEERYVKKTLLAWLKREAETYFERTAPVLAARMSVSYKQIKYRQQKSRWGSCSSGGVLSFNWRLIHFKPDVIDYVIIHELTHLKHMDHSARFWGMVEQFDPSYKEKVRFLKNQVIAIEKM